MYSKPFKIGAQVVGRGRNLVILDLDHPLDVFHDWQGVGRDGEYVVHVHEYVLIILLAVGP
jgi:hypothetical protein